MTALVTWFTPKRIRRIQNEATIESTRNVFRMLANRVRSSLLAFCIGCLFFEKKLLGTTFSQLNLNLRNHFVQFTGFLSFLGGLAIEVIMCTRHPIVLFCRKQFIQRQKVLRNLDKRLIWSSYKNTHNVAFHFPVILLDDFSWQWRGGDSWSDGRRIE